jgi:hypothetical protein
VALYYPDDANVVVNVGLLEAQFTGLYVLNIAPV